MHLSKCLNLETKVNNHNIYRNVYTHFKVISKIFATFQLNLISEIIVINIDRAINII